MNENLAEKIQDEPLPTSPDELMGALDQLEIPYERYDHKAVYTVEESQHLEGDIPGAHCRNLFLRDKKKKMYLVVALNETAIDMKKLQNLIGSDRLSFGSADRLWQYLGVRPGSVCPFSVINDTEQQVKIILDKDMMDADIVNYHPLLNTITIGLSPADLTKFIKSTGHDPMIIDLKPAAPDN